MEIELLLDSLKDNVLALDRAGHVTYLNACCAETLCIKREETIGKRISKLRGPIIGKETLEAFNEALQSPEAKIIEWNNPPDRFWEMTLSPTVEGLVAVFRDVTSDKKARISLEESEEKYRNLVENSKDSIILVDFKGNILFANHVSETLTGYSINEIPNIRDVIPKKLWMKAVTMLLRAKMGKPIPFFKYEIVKKDGTITPVETGGQAILKNGKPVAIQIITRDISERQIAEQALADRNRKLAESEARYRELYDSLDQAFIATDWDLNVTHWNKAAEKMTEKTKAQAVGKKMYDVLPDSQLIDINRYSESLIAGQNVHFTVKRPSPQTGAEIVFGVSVYPSANGILYIIEDKTEEEATRRLSAIGTTASMVGHDIRNPLQAIIADVFLINSIIKEHGSVSNQEIQESLVSIEDNINYINKIIADLQDYSRILRPSIQEIDLSNILDTVYKTMKVPSNIVLSVDKKHLKLKTDPEFIRRALVNLVTNAIQAIPSGGRVDISSFEKKDRIYITVADNGKGIPEEVKSKLFSPMVTTKAKGQGLGLAVVKRLVQALEGNVTFDSQIDKGTKFTIELPKKE